jgi:hypothetical protein
LLKRRYSFYFGLRSTRTSKTRSFDISVATQSGICDISDFAVYIVIRFTSALVQHVKNKTGSFDSSVATQNGICDISDFCGMFGICGLHPTPLKRRFSEALRGHSRHADRRHCRPDGQAAAAAATARGSSSSSSSSSRGA